MIDNEQRREANARRMWRIWESIGGARELNSLAGVVELKPHFYWYWRPRCVKQPWRSRITDKMWWTFHINLWGYPWKTFMVRTPWFLVGRGI